MRERKISAADTVLEALAVMKGDLIPFQELVPQPSRAKVETSSTNDGDG
jgi:hypothetical protein